MYYTVRFQNIGTASAIDVRIEDVLDARIDPVSIRMIASSHDYIMERIGTAVTWEFEDIYLPSVLQNEESSKGYVMFKVKLLPGFAVGDIIPNTAEIYFDNNAPIITNTFDTEFTQQLALNDNVSGTVVMYPNPANNLLVIQSSSEILTSVILYDVTGKQVISEINLQSVRKQLDVARLARGMYIVEIKTESGLRMIKKLIKD